MNATKITVAGFKTDLPNWERTYNHIRPHRALRYLTPAQFLATFNTTSPRGKVEGRGRGSFRQPARQFETSPVLAKESSAQPQEPLRQAVNLW